MSKIITLTLLVILLVACGAPIGVTGDVSIQREANIAPEICNQTEFTSIKAGESKSISKGDFTIELNKVDNFNFNIIVRDEGIEVTKFEALPFTMTTVQVEKEDLVKICVMISYKETK